MLVALATTAWAQPGPPRPHAPGRPPVVPGRTAPNPAPSGSPSGVSVPHVVGNLSYYSPTRCTVQRETGNGGPTANMDFHMDAKAFQTPGLKNHERVVVVYQMDTKAGGYQALAVVRCPQGGNPQDILKNLKLPQAK